MTSCFSLDEENASYVSLGSSLHHGEVATIYMCDGVYVWNFVHACQDKDYKLGLTFIYW